MTDTQVTLAQIDNYGPWTTTPAPRREPDLQALQASLYADLAEQVGAHDGYVFYTRFDNMVAVTNGLDRAAHERIQETVRNRYPVTLSLSVAAERTPAAALSTASAQLQAAGSAQDVDRREVLAGAVDADAGPVEIAHFDVVDATEKYTDGTGAYETFLRIEEGYAALARHLHATHDALAFFVGGDNVIAVCPRLDPAAYAGAMDHVREETGLDLRVGVGRGPTACDAGLAAKQRLEECREDQVRVGVPATVSGD
ncbi:MAG: GTP cyclohydrolase IIa [Halobacteriaceae archaeon]